MLFKNFASVFELLSTYPQLHARNSVLYRFVESILQHDLQAAKDQKLGEFKLGNEFGTILLPYEKMGTIDSIDLFGLDELLMFTFYLRNRGRYHKAADIGANIGLHSILLSRMGCKVESYEPDPQHYEKLQRNLALNDITTATVHQAAVSDHSGNMQFVRVLGNTTSSHLAGSKANPYGELERFDVSVTDIRKIAERVDLLKIDAEGHEAVILNALPI